MNLNKRRQILEEEAKRIQDEILLTIYSDPELAARRTPEEVRDDLKEIGIDPATLPDRWKVIVRVAERTGLHDSAESLSELLRELATALTEAVRDGFGRLFAGALPARAADATMPLVFVSVLNDRMQGRVYREPDQRLALLLETSDLKLAGARVRITSTACASDSVILTQVDNHTVAGTLAIPSTFGVADVASLSFEFVLE